jgi:hypothetical protein
MTKSTIAVNFLNILNIPFNVEPYQLGYLSKEYWPGWRESNPHSHFRRMLSCPLNDSRNFGASGGIRTLKDLAVLADFKSAVYTIPPHSQSICLLYLKKFVESISIFLIAVFGAPGGI